MDYDKSYNALFNPGSASDLFSQYQTIAFQPTINHYSPANAWWLAECCRLSYKIDDQNRQASHTDEEVSQILARIGWSLQDVVIDSVTSTCAALFQSAQHNDSNDKPALVAVFCGSNEALDWKINFQAGQVSTAVFGNVHAGFLTGLNSVSDKLLNVISRHVGPVYLAGHSLGAALASLMAVELKVQKIPFNACYSFGSPRVGNQQFTRILATLPFYRIVNNCDLVTSLPLSLGANEYVHPDNAIFLDPHGGVALGITDNDIQQRQAVYFPALKRYLDSQQLMSRITSLPTSLPDNFADHAIVNYVQRFSGLLGAT